MQVDHKHKALINYSRAQVVNILKTAKPPKQNFSKEEISAIKELKSYDDIVILNADEGNCTAVLDKTEYHKKVSILLQDPKTYRTVKKNPTSRFEKRLNSFVWNLFECKKLSFSMYKFLRSTDSVLPRMYGLPKIHKPNLPLRPIVSFVGSATYQLSKFLKNILSPLVGNTVHTVKNSAEFVELIEKINILDNESQMSFDVVSLFTSIPLETARAIVLDRLSNDCTLEDRTNLTITELTEALDICLTSTYFT